MIGLHIECVQRSAGAIDPTGAKAERLGAAGIAAVRGNEADRLLRHAQAFDCSLIYARIGLEDTDIAASARQLACRPATQLRIARKSAIRNPCARLLNFVKWASHGLVITEE